MLLRKVKEEGKVGPVPQIVFCMHSPKSLLKSYWSRQEISESSHPVLGFRIRDQCCPFPENAGPPHLDLVPLQRARSLSPVSHAHTHALRGRVQSYLGSGFRAHVREEGKDRWGAKEMVKRLKRKTKTEEQENWAPDTKWDWEEFRSRSAAANVGTDRTT